MVVDNLHTDITYGFLYTNFTYEFFRM